MRRCGDLRLAGFEFVRLAAAGSITLVVACISRIRLDASQHNHRHTGVCRNAAGFLRYGEGHNVVAFRSERSSRAVHRGTIADTGSVCDAAQRRRKRSVFSCRHPDAFTFDNVYAELHVHRFQRHSANVHGARYAPSRLVHHTVERFHAHKRLERSGQFRFAESSTRTIYAQKQKRP